MSPASAHDPHHPHVLSFPSTRCVPKNRITVVSFEHGCGRRKVEEDEGEAVCRCEWVRSVCGSKSNGDVESRQYLVGAF